MSTKAQSQYSNSFFHHADNSTKHHQQTRVEPQNVFAEVSGDLHLKMLKKIAQLTKVIYALNTKNDEHENVISNIRAQHNEEKELLIQETNKKLEEFKQKFSTSNDNSKQIESLKMQIKESFELRNKIEQDYNEFKLESLKREQKFSDNYSHEINEMTKQMETLRAQFEMQLKEFKDTNSKYEHEKLYLIEDLKSKHRIEIDNLKQSYNSNKDSFLSEKLKLEEQHKQELIKLQLFVDELKTQNQSVISENEANINKLKAFHAKELEALKANSNQEYLANLNELKNEIEKIKREKIELENDWKRKLDRKLEEIVEKDEEIDVLKQKLASINQNLESSGKNLDILNNELLQVKIENENTIRKLAHLEVENRDFKDKYDQQVFSINEKTNIINKLESEVMENRSYIKDLQSEAKTLKSRLTSLEREKSQLESLSSNQSEVAYNQLKTLEKALEELKQEKKNLIEKHKKSLESLEQSHKDDIYKLNLEIKLQKEKLADEYEFKLSNERAQMEEKLLTLERNHKRDFNVETQKLIKERDRLHKDFNKLTKELNEKTKEFEAEIDKLNKDLSENKNELKMTRENVYELTEDKKSLLIELDQLKQSFSKEKNELNRLKEDYEKLSLIHEASTKDSQIDTKVKLEKLSKELNEKWSITLKQETEILRRELLSKTEEEHRLAIEKLTKAKEDEINNLKETWQSKNNSLLDEISQLKKQLSLNEIAKREEIDRIRVELSEENKKLRLDFEKLEEDYKRKFDELEKLYSSDKSKIIETLNRDNELKLNEMKRKYFEDLQAQILAHKTAVSSMKQSWEKNKQLEFEVKEEEFKKEIEFMKNDLQQVHYCEIDDLKRAFDKELLASRMEVERSLEIIKLKELDARMKADEYQSELTLSQKSISSLNREIEKLNQIIEELKRELSGKNEEIEQVKFDAMNDIINKENNLKRLHLDEFNALNAENIRQKQALISEFKQAQEILKKRIVELQDELNELQLKYESRESREEDLEMIRNLRQTLKDKEETFKKLEDEKKYFKMELVNRETNFNKVFNNLPNIGVINPLNVNKKKSGTNGKTSPAQQQQQRLDPIPGGSPFHEQPLNPNKLLPKRFL